MVERIHSPDLWQRVELRAGWPFSVLGIWITASPWADSTGTTASRTVARSAYRDLKNGLTQSLTGLRSSVWAATRAAHNSAIDGDCSTSTMSPRRSKRPKPLGVRKSHPKPHHFTHPGSFPTRDQ